MKERTVTLPAIGLIAATRVVLGMGIGLLISNRFGRHQRRSVGKAMVVAGAISTIPIALLMSRHRTIGQKLRTLAA